MLATHSIDLCIVEILQKNDGLSLSELSRELSTISKHSVSVATVKRHLPGLQRLGCIDSSPAERDGRTKTVWYATKPDNQDN